MPFLNAFRPPAPLPEEEYHLETSPDEYDLNSCYPVPEEAALRTDGVKLVPIIVRPTHRFPKAIRDPLTLSSPHLIPHSPLCTAAPSTPSSPATPKATNTSPSISHQP